MQKFINILDGLDGLDRTFADHSNGTQIIVARLDSPASTCIKTRLARRGWRICRSNGWITNLIQDDNSRAYSRLTCGERSRTIRVLLA